MQLQYYIFAGFLIEFILTDEKNDNTNSEILKNVIFKSDYAVFKQKVDYSEIRQPFNEFESDLKRRENSVNETNISPIIDPQNVLMSRDFFRDYWNQMAKSNEMLKQYAQVHLESIRSLFTRAKNKVETYIGIFKSPLNTSLKNYVTVSKPNSVGIQKKNKQQFVANLTKQAILTAEATIHGYNSGNWSKFSDVLVENVKKIAEYEGNSHSGNMSSSDEFLLAFQVHIVYITYLVYKYVFKYYNIYSSYFS